MGAWGVAIFSDDLAADLRDEFRDLIGDGLSSTEAVDRLIAEYASSLSDSDEASVFWIALACIQWKLGRLEDRTQREALRVIDSGEDLERWDDAADRKKRVAVLEKARNELLSPQPAAKRVPRRIREANDWSPGELIGLRLLSGRWTVMRVIGHHTDRGGRFAVCELLDWTGKELPAADILRDVPIKRDSEPGRISQFLFVAPRKKADRARVVRCGATLPPSQKPGGFTVLVWPYVDQLLERLFGLT